MNGAGTVLPTRAGREDIVSFVREVLGCGCPDEVFRRIDIGTGRCSPDGPDFARLVVGERLLIYILAPDGRDIAGNVRSLAARGLAERDAEGYNRFRLVAVLPMRGEDAALGSGAFASVAGEDPHAHLHCLEASNIPSGLLPADPAKARDPRP